MQNTGKNTLTVEPARKSGGTKKRSSKRGARSKRVTAKSNPVGSRKKASRRAGAAPKNVDEYMVIMRGFNRGIMYAIGAEARGDNFVNTLSYDWADATIFKGERAAQRAADHIMAIQHKYDDHRAAIVVPKNATEATMQKKLADAERGRKTNPAPTTGYVISHDRHNVDEADRFYSDGEERRSYWNGSVWVNFPSAKRYATRKAATPVLNSLREIYKLGDTQIESVSSLKKRMYPPFGGYARRTKNPDTKSTNKYIVAIAGGVGSAKILAYWDGAGWSWEHRLAARFTKAAATELAERAAKANKRPAMVARFDVAPGQISHKIAAGN